MIDLAADEALYEKVKSRLDRAQQDHIANLKRQHEAGERVYYGHDLYHAIQRGQRQEEIDALDALFAMIAERQHPQLPINTHFRRALTALICAGAARGVTAEAMRRSLRSEADRDDSCRLEKTVERYSPKSD